MQISKLPIDLAKELSKTPSALSLWDGLSTVAKHDFITWIDGAKQRETRVRRIQKARSVLIAGKRRPCCYAVVPMHLYKALDGNIKAKAVWKTLTPMEKRELATKVDGLTDVSSRTKMIEQICSALVKRKSK